MLDITQDISGTMGSCYSAKVYSASPSTNFNVNRIPKTTQLLNEFLGKKLIIIQFVGQGSV